MTQLFSSEELRQTLDDQLDALFRPSETNGFWHESQNRLLRALKFQVDEQDRFIWSADLRECHRYVPFALIGIMQWRISRLANDSFDDKLIRNLQRYAVMLESDEQFESMPSDCVGPLLYSFSTAHRVWPDATFADIARRLSNCSVQRFSHSIDELSLFLMGLAAYEDKVTPGMQERIRELTENLRACQDAKGLYRLKGMPESFRHQNQMCTIWGLVNADMALRQSENLASIRRCLSYTVARRMQPDGALLWHHHRNFFHSAFTMSRQILTAEERESRRLYSCHQVFFVYAAQAYRQISGDDSFDEPVRRAMSWLYGNNVRGENLFQRTGIGVPMRMMTKSGRFQLKSQLFIGSYEIGGLIMALVSLLESTMEHSA